MAGDETSFSEDQTPPLPKQKAVMVAVVGWVSLDGGAGLAGEAIRVDPGAVALLVADVTARAAVLAQRKVIAVEHTCIEGVLGHGVAGRRRRSLGRFYMVWRAGLNR